MTRARMMFRRARLAAGAVPTNSVAPAFSGPTTVGATLTASTGTWTGSPTGYVYQHQQSDDGSTGWADISGATSQTFSPGAGLTAKYVRPGVRASNAYGSALAYAYGAAVGPIADAPLIPTIAPTNQWTGTAGTGFGTANPNAPLDPTRDGPKAMGRLLTTPQISFGEDHTIVVTADAYGGVSTVRAWCEGNSVDLTLGQVPYTDANGVSRELRGYSVALDHAAIMALNPTGDMYVYFEIVPILSSVIQTRVIGPYHYYARAPGVGAGKVYDYEVRVIPGSPAVAGVSYPTIIAALNYMQSVSAKFPHILLSGDGQRFTTAGTVTTIRNAATSWAIIEAEPGTTAYLGNDDTTWTLPGYDGLCFRGSSIVMEVYRMTNNGTWAMRSHAGAFNWFWCDGIEITGGTPNPANGGTGSGAKAMFYGNPPSVYFFSRNNSNPYNWYFTEVNAHDLPGYGIQHAELIRNSTLTMVSGSGCELNHGAIHGLDISKCDGVQTGFRVDMPAFVLTYTGSATVAEYAKVRQDNGGVAGANGRSSFLYFYEDSASPTHTITITNGSGASNTTVQSVIDQINALPNWSATTPATDGTILNAAFLSLPGLAPSLGISKRVITAPQQFITIADVHANTITMDGTTGTVFENTLIEFVNGFSLIEQASLAINTVKDLSIRNCSFQDISVVSGYPVQNSIITGTTLNHILIDALTMTGVGNTLQIGKATPPSVNATFGPYSKFSRIAAEGIFRVATNDPNLEIDKVAIRTSTIPANATNSVDLGDIAEDTMYVDPAAIPPNLTPLAPLQFGDGTWAGRYLPDGSEQEAA